jgi:transcriptional regulator with XRE-family HTH domain
VAWVGKNPVIVNHSYPRENWERLRQKLDFQQQVWVPWQKDIADGLNVTFSRDQSGPGFHIKGEAVNAAEAANLLNDFMSRYQDHWDRQGIGLLTGALVSNSRNRLERRYGSGSTLTKLFPEFAARLDALIERISLLDVEFIANGAPRSEIVGEVLNVLHRWAIRDILPTSTEYDELLKLSVQITWLHAQLIHFVQAHIGEQAPFARLLNWHLDAGTRPNLSNSHQWRIADFARGCGVTTSAVSRWRTGAARPSERSFGLIERTLFGDTDNLLRVGLREAWQRSEPSEQTEADFKSAEQRPAAYRFGIQNGKIDILPEPPEPTDVNVAQDILQELLKKARALQYRLSQTNSAERAFNSVNDLLDALDGGFAALREGIILSRVRSIEADRYAYDTEEGRNELFPDAIASLDDTLQTARDLLALFPKVRQIEAERIALELERDPQAIPSIERDMAAISQAAKQSVAVSVAATDALDQNDRAIENARNTSVRISLIGDKLLVVRNFVGALVTTIRTELAGLGADSWKEIRKELPVGTAMATRALPLVLLGTLIAGPTGGIAMAVAAFKPLSKMYDKMEGNKKPE